MMKSCGFCKGRGVVLKTVPSVNINSYGTYMMTVKIPCTKCFGKGSR